MAEPGYDDELEREQRRRQRERRKKLIRRRRRFLALVAFVFVCAIACFLFMHRKTGEEVAEEENISYGAAGNISVGEASAVVTEAPPPAPVSADAIYTVSGQMGDGLYEGILPVADAMSAGEALDVSGGRAAVDLTGVERTKRVFAARAAMEQRAFFTGTIRTVNDYLREYGEGAWHGIRDVSDELVIFYEGIRKNPTKYIGASGSEQVLVEDVPFKVSFVVYEDGSFAVRQVTVGDETLEDPEKWLEELVRKS